MQFFIVLSNIIAIFAVLNSITLIGYRCASYNAHKFAGFFMPDFKILAAAFPTHCFLPR